MTRFLKLTVLIAAAFVALMACQSTAVKTDAPMAVSEIKMVKLMIPGADCASTGAEVEYTLSEIDGVSDVEIDLDEESATLKYDTAKTSIEAMNKKLQTVNYTIISSEEIK